MPGRPTNADLWAALLDIALAPPALGPQEQRALGHQLRDLLQVDHRPPTAARLRELLDRIAATEPAPPGRAGQSVITACMGGTCAGGQGEPSIRASSRR